MLDKKSYPDYLLIKDMPVYKAGCIFSVGQDYLYYISYNPSESNKSYKSYENNYKYSDTQLGNYYKQNDSFMAHSSLIRYNIYQISNNPEWFQEITKEIYRNLQLNGKLI